MRWLSLTITAQIFSCTQNRIVLGEHVWICAEAFVSLGVRIPDGVVLGARALLTKSIDESWTVHAGHPAKQIGPFTRS